MRIFNTHCYYYKNTGYAVCVVTNIAGFVHKGINLARLSKCLHLGLFRLVNAGLFPLSKIISLIGDLMVNTRQHIY